MKSARISRSTFVLALLAALFASAFNLQAADTVNIQATLILGTNDGQGVDSALRQYETNLKRALSSFDTFKRQGSGSASIAVPGSSKISIGAGQSVAVDVKPAGDGKYRIAANWAKGSQTYIDLEVVASKGRPTVLVGPNSGSGKLILLLIAN